MQPAIEIQHLGKQYMRSEAAPYIALRDVISGSVRNIFRKSDNPPLKFWALDDISLTIQPGERMGIIGRNGAGKSTLLKIISRITPPSKGEVVIRGRVGSLLEVGTGFHPELTGRENIYLNGSILGLKRAEINKQLDAIIDFSGVKKFIDSPLKHYSSGMQMRLAFAVAAHLDSEILLIDEVLAVGDMEFQKKCLGKMEEVSKSQGRTLLFVSHNMNYIAGLCERVILLDKGQLVKTGDAPEIINHYTHDIVRNFSENNLKESSASGAVRLKAIRILGETGSEKNSFKANEPIGIEMQYEVLEAGHVLWLGFNLHNQEGLNVFDTHSVGTEFYDRPHGKGIYTGIAWIPGNLMNTGNYFISCAVFNHLKHVIHFHEKDISMFSVYDVFDEETARGKSPNDFPGIVRPLLNWKISKLEHDE